MNIIVFKKPRQLSAFLSSVTTDGAKLAERTILVLAVVDGIGGPVWSVVPLLTLRVRVEGTLIPLR